MQNHRIWETFGIFILLLEDTLFLQFYKLIAELDGQ
jgi:hypothetical protein